MKILRFSLPIFNAKTGRMPQAVQALILGNFYALCHFPLSVLDRV
jgi:hypothetical protein